MTPTTDDQSYDFGEVLADWNRYFDDLNAGRVDPVGEWTGQYVAYFDGKVFDYGPDPNTLRDRAADALNVLPQRIVLSYLA